MSLTVVGLYGFKPQFVPYILDFSKRHTIRGERKYPDAPGDRMHLFTGLRTKRSTLLLRPLCTSIENCAIRLSEKKSAVYIQGQLLSASEMDLLAWRDGFRPPGSTESSPGNAWPLMRAFWLAEHPSTAIHFTGHIYHWNPYR